MKHQPVMLIIMDGWGLRDDPRANAITEAHPHYYENLLKTCSWTKLDPSGEAVGLPPGQMGNSEVGHMNIGSGRIVYQELTRIDKAIADKSFFKNDVLVAAMDHAKTNQTTLHLMGLVSDGGVHSSLNHLFALLDMAKQKGIEKVRVHAFLDGRDVGPQSALTYLEELEGRLMDLDYPQVATVCGRYYAMDRDKRWDRIEKAYNMLVLAEGRHSLLSRDAVKLSYNNDETDEFVTPSICDLTFKGMEDGDSILFFNFRPDRARQITQAITEPNFDGFERKKTLAFPNTLFTCMTMYDERLTLPIAYPKQSMDNVLAKVLSEHDIKQFRTAETEKYAHVTYFFNGGFETPFPGEERQLVASPHVATYDMQPEMSLPGVTDVLVHALESKQYEFIAANFANPDMVGHTGKMDAAIKAVQAVDSGLEKTIDKACELGWVVLLTADHGNIELMAQPDGTPHTAHTTELVPLVLIAKDKTFKLDSSGVETLSDIAPTILDIMDIPKPSEMTGQSLLIARPSKVAS